MYRAAVLMLAASALVLGDAQTDALYQAARTGDLAAVDALLAQQVSATTPEAGGNTPLHAAALNGHREIAEHLLVAGAKVDAHHRDDQATPLHYAITGNHADVAELLLDKGADPNATYGDSLTGLHLAAGRGYTRMIEILIAHHAELDPRSGSGATPLEDAIRRGAKDIVQRLLDAGADTTSPNSKSLQTPLHIAAGLNDAGMAVMLIDHGAPLTARDRNGYMPFDVAMQFQRKEIVNLLLDRGTPLDVDAVMHQAVLRNQIQLIRVLIGRAKPPVAQGLLSDAAVKGFGEMVTFLVENGVNVNGRNSDGATPLHDAALGGSKDVARILLTHGGDLAARDRDNEATPLHVAASWGRKDVVEFLLAAGADASLKDKNGKTALDLAVANQQTEIAAVLRRPARR